MRLVSRSWPTPPVRRWLIVLMLALLTPGVAGSAQGDPQPDPHRLAGTEVDLPSGEVTWRAVFRSAVADTDPVLDTEAGILVAGSELLLLLDEATGQIERIPRDGALVVEADRQLRPLALAEGDASLLAIAVALPDSAPTAAPPPGEGYGPVGEPFAVEAGRYTLATWRYDVEDDGLAAFHERLGDLRLPALLHVEEGAIEVPEGDPAEPAQILAGEQAVIDGGARPAAVEEPAVIVLATLTPIADAAGETSASGSSVSGTTTAGRSVTQPTAAATTQPTEAPESTATVEPTAMPIDSDGDGLTDEDELARGTNPMSNDSDGDGVFDGFEVGIGLDPLKPDTDGDGVSDYLEVPEEQSPGSEDPDGDGLTDAFEGQVSLTNPNDFDSDDDGLGDGDERARGTNPLAADSDGDGLSDGAEIGYGSSPLSRDTDGEGLSDAFEVGRGTNPASSDSDGDGVDDGYETGRGMNPLSGDSDGDGLGDGAEVNTYGSNPLNPDSDADGRSDGYEVDCGQDPNTVTDYTDVVAC